MKADRSIAVGVARMLAAPAIAVLLVACGSERDPAAIAPPGAPETGTTAALEAGASLLQSPGPVAGLDIHVVGFHPMKDAPHHQMEAHHFCRQVNEDFAQCALFDGDSPAANLNGVEYIISGRLFETLPAAERQYWHPHNGEILSGQLVAPGLPLAAESALMRRKINSYGKTWHTWQTRHAEAAGDALPLGPAMLAWSFNRDGELDPGLLARRDQALDIRSPERRAARESLRPLAGPQHGVDALRDAFPEAVPIPGVVDVTSEPP